MRCCQSALTAAPPSLLLLLLQAASALHMFPPGQEGLSLWLSPTYAAVRGQDGWLPFTPPTVTGPGVGATRSSSEQLLTQAGSSHTASHITLTSSCSPTCSTSSITMHWKLWAFIVIARKGFEHDSYSLSCTAGFMCILAYLCFPV